MYKFGDIVLDDLEGFGIKEIDMPMLPPSESDSIETWSDNGDIFSGSRKKKRQISIKFCVECDDKDTYDTTVDAIADAFDVDAPQAFYIEDEEKFIYCIPEDEVEFGDVVIRDNKCYGEGSVSLVAYDPYFYIEEAKIFEGDKKITYTNEGKKPCPCIINVNLEQDACYLQVSDSNGKAILLGTYPSLVNKSVNEKEKQIDEVCETKTNFSNGSFVDANRVVTGGVDVCAVNEGGWAIVANDYGSGDKWHGPSIRRNLIPDIIDFEVQGYFYFDSTGKLKYNENASTNTTTTTKYKVTATSIALKEKRLSSSKTIKTIKKGVYLTPVKVDGKEATNGWIKTTYDSKTGWAKISKGLKKITTKTSNYYTNHTASLRSGASKKTKLLATIPNGTAVNYLNITSGKWSKVTYDGKTGYVWSEYLTKGSDTTIETDEDIVVAENQLGLLEMYGCDVNGVKLFKFMLCDDQKYFESNYPVVQIGNKTVLEDKDFKLPEVKFTTTTEGSGDKLTIKKHYLNMGQYGDWNEFKGHFTIKREGTKWSVEVVKYNSSGEIVKTIKPEDIRDSDFPTGNLNHIDVFFGQYGEEKAVDTMTLNRIIVNKLNDTTQEDTNLYIFKAGDEISIDTLNQKVYKNGELFMDYIDYGSYFFNLEQGENAITINSDSPISSSSVIFNERFNR